eukprot:scaffold17663_cov54-Attheya_sp.AAC.2
MTSSKDQKDVAIEMESGTAATSYGSTSTRTASTGGTPRMVHMSPRETKEFLRSTVSHHQGVYPQNFQQMVLAAAASSASSEEEDGSTSLTHRLLSMDDASSSIMNKHNNNNNNTPQSLLRRWAIRLSLYVNLAILLAKVIAYANTLSLSVLAALVDSVLDVVSQLVLTYTEKHSSLQRSSALYPAGASRLEPVGVLTCAALMGMASFEVLKQSLGALLGPLLHHEWAAQSTLLIDSATTTDASDFSNSFWSMTIVVGVKLLLLLLCQKASEEKISLSSQTSSVGGQTSSTVVRDPTLEALALDHWNDALSNGVAAGALFCTILSPDLWFLDPMGAILISVYIIVSWYSTGKEQIEQLTGKCAPDDFIQDITTLAQNFDSRMDVDVCRAYHFGPKFLVEIEVVLPRDTLLFESHDLGMELQYEIEGREEVERCFVHIDYESRPYDEHVVSKVPELRALYKHQQSSSCASI